MRKKAAGNAEKAIDAVTTIEPIKTRAPAKRSQTPRISLAALAMGTAAVPAVNLEKSPAAKKARPANVGKATPAAKSAEPAAKVAKVAKVSKTAKSAKVAEAVIGAATAAGTKRPIKGIRLASSLAGLANANPTPFVEEAQEVPVPEVVLSAPPITTPDPAMEIRLAAPAEVMPPPVLVAARSRPQPPRRWMMSGLALLAIALAGLVVTQFGATGDDAQAPIAAQTPAMAGPGGGPVPYGPGPYRPAAYRPYAGPDHGGHYVDNEGRAYGRYGRDSTHW